MVLLTRASCTANLMILEIVWCQVAILVGEVAGGSGGRVRNQRGCLFRLRPQVVEFWFCVSCDEEVVLVRSSVPSFLVSVLLL